VWGSGDLFLSLKGLGEGPVGNWFVNSRGPLCWLLLFVVATAAAAAAAAAVQDAGQTAHWMQGNNDSCGCLHVFFPHSENHSEKQPFSLSLPIFTQSVWMSQKKGLKGHKWEEKASSWSRVGPFRASSQPHPLPLPLPLPASWAASPSAASYGFYTD